MALTPKQKLCIELMLSTNKSYGLIAQELSINPNTITTWLKNDEFNDVLDRGIKRRFNGMALAAQKRLEHLINSNNEAVALGAVKEVLSKAGYDAVQKQEILETTITVTMVDD